MKRILIMFLVISCAAACGVKRDLKLPEKSNEAPASKALNEEGRVNK